MRRWRSKRFKSTTTFHPDACSAMADLLPLLEAWKKSGELPVTSSSQSGEGYDDAGSLLPPLLPPMSTHILTLFGSLNYVFLSAFTLLCLMCNSCHPLYFIVLIPYIIEMANDDDAVVINTDNHPPNTSLGWDRERGRGSDDERNRGRDDDRKMDRMRDRDRDRDRDRPRKRGADDQDVLSQSQAEVGQAVTVFQV